MTSQHQSSPAREPLGAPSDGSRLHVWLAGDRLQVEEPDGSPKLIVGDDVTWSFGRSHDEPLEVVRAEVRYQLRGAGLLRRRSASGFEGNDFTRPTGPVSATTFLGRRAWAVELAPPEHKPHPIQLVVDAETGWVLSSANDGFGSVDEWVELVVGEPLDESRFRWDGPVRSEADEQVARRVAHEADLRARRDWLAELVIAQPLRVQLDLDLQLHWWDDDTGAFEASVLDGLGSLARRPVSSEPWDFGGRGEAHRWADGRWDWALTLHSGRLAPGSQAIQRQLSSGAG